METQPLPVEITKGRKEILLERYLEIRKFTLEICNPLESEDYVVQPIVDVSPPKWHLAHSTWFFEEMLLKKIKAYKAFNPDYGYLFNSYYESIGGGERVLRPERGRMTRPTVAKIIDYRHHVDKYMHEFLLNELSFEVMDLVELGLQHEQQHQELLVTDIKYIFGHNPLFPVYIKSKLEQIEARELGWLHVEGGLYDVGYSGSEFCFDNELSRHKSYIEPFKAMDRLVTAGEYLEFIEDGGYSEFQWWLSEGWDWVKTNKILAPLYWHKVDGKWHHYTMYGFIHVNAQEPVTHISYFEADAFSQWKNMRLLNENEWEVLTSTYGNLSNDGFVDRRNYHPGVAKGNNQLLGFCWEWTQSAYLPYPGFQKKKGAVGEYNGKFMINQMVLRGGSCATSMSHIRTTYRNFFHPHLRWQFTGIRLAETI